MVTHSAVRFILSPDTRTYTRRVVRRPAPKVEPAPMVVAAPPQPPMLKDAEPPAPSSSEMPFADCADYEARGGCQTVLHQRYAGNRGDILRCKTCGRTFSSRRGGIDFKSRLPKETIRALVDGFNRGDSIRKIARSLSLNRGTVRRYFRLLEEKPVPPSSFEEGDYSEVETSL